MPTEVDLSESLSLLHWVGTFHWLSYNYWGKVTPFGAADAPESVLRAAQASARPVRSAGFARSVPRVALTGWPAPARGILSTCRGIAIIFSLGDATARSRSPTIRAPLDVVLE